MDLYEPTVYDSPHIGHARLAVSFDLIWKYLEFKGYDDISVGINKRQQVNDSKQLCVRLGQAFIAIVISLSHHFTGFIEGAPANKQPDLAFIGIRIHTPVIPAIVMLIMAILFAVMYKLEPDTVNKNKVKMKELGFD